MQLFYKDKLLGTIQNSGGSDLPWMTGDLVPTSEFYEFQKFFEALTDEDETIDLDSFDSSFFEEGNWGIEDNGIYKYIFPPAIHNDMTINWRWNE